MPKFLPTLVLAFFITICAGWALFVGFARLDGADLSLTRPTIGAAGDTDLSVVARTTVTAAGLVVGVFAVVYSYRKQRIEEAASYRADADSFSKRYQEAAGQLGHSNAVVRLAGAYALYQLAQDWDEQRQSCVSVLCAYLRVPPSELADGDSEVRATIQRLLTSFMQESAQGNIWQAIRFDLSGAHLHNFDLSYVSSFGMLEMSGATISGTMSLNEAYLEEGLIMENVVLNACTFAVRRSRFGLIRMDGANIRGNSQLTLEVDDFNLVSLRRCIVEDSSIEVRVGSVSDGSDALSKEVILTDFTARNSSIRFGSLSPASENQRFNVRIGDGVLVGTNLQVEAPLLPNRSVSDLDTLKRVDDGSVQIV